MKYKVKTKDCQLTVKAKTSWGESIDAPSLDAFSRMYLRGFLKPKQVKNNLIEYSGPTGVSLSERLKRPISKHEFFFIVEQIVVMVKKVRTNRLMLHQIILDTEYVFINEATKELQFLYVPMAGNSECRGIVDFIESVVYQAKPFAEGDLHYTSRLIRFIRSQKGFNPDVIEQYIATEDRSAVASVRRQNAGQSGYMTNKQQHYVDHYNNQKKVPTLDATDLLDEELPTGLLDEDLPTGLLEDDFADMDATGLLGEDDEDGTALLVEEPGLVEDVHFPSLTRILTDETVSINKPVFRLGKEKSYVDYFIPNNNTVSRSHADIIVRGTKCFVLDLNSKNRTFVNNVPIPIQCEVELHDGDKLRLSNEEFIFHI